MGAAKPVMVLPRPVVSQNQERPTKVLVGRRLHGFFDPVGHQLNPGCQLGPGVGEEIPTGGLRGDQDRAGPTGRPEDAQASTPRTAT